MRKSDANSFFRHDIRVLDAKVMEEKIKLAYHEFADTPSYLATSADGNNCSQTQRSRSTQMFL